MKFSDDAFDVDNNLNLAIFFGIICAIVSAIATVSDIGAAYIFIGIVVGTLLAFKIDGVHHLITLIIFIIICLILGLPDLNIVVLLICILAPLTDEVGHELISNVTENGFIILFFEYRFVMKIVIFLLALCGVFSFWTFIIFIFFEIGYLMAGLLYKN